jgi:centromere protein I
MISECPPHKKSTIASPTCLTAYKWVRTRQTRERVEMLILTTAAKKPAYEDGLSTECLGLLVDIITLPNELDQGSLGSLIRNLFPARKVPDVVVIRVVGSLGQGRAKPSYTAQGALLKWLVMVHDVLENVQVLSQLYSILFNLLDTAAIRYVFHKMRNLFI